MNSINLGPTIPQVKDILRKYPELWGILGRKTILALGGARVELIDERILARENYPARYLIVTTDRRLAVEVGVGLGRFFSVWREGKDECVFDALQRTDVACVEYVLEVHKEIELGGELYSCSRLTIHKLPAGKNMADHVHGLEGKFLEIRNAPAFYD